MRILLALLVAALLVGAALLLRPGASLRAAFDARRAALILGPAAAPVTEADLAALPPPVRRWLRRAGVLGRPPARMVHAVFETELFAAPGAPPMTGISHQIDVIDPPRRLFFMGTRRSGLPVAVLHDYAGHEATMRVRLMRAVDVVDLAGPELSRAETVTFLNDLCAFAPSALLGPGFAWAPVSDREADVTFTNGPHAVSARLTFDAAGDLVGFRSEDRSEFMPDGSLRPLPWTTPLSEHRAVRGRRAPGRGEAVWHRPEGPFTYGTFRLVDLLVDEEGL